MWTAAHLMIALASSALAPSLEVRRSAVSLVPPEPLMLGGYTERQGALFEPGGDDLQARTLVLSLGGVRVAVCSVELLTVPESLAREVRSRVPSDLHLLLTATHTHCAPDSQMLNDRMTFAIPGIASYKRRWLNWYADRIAGGINDALAASPRSITNIELRQARLAMSRVRRPMGKADPMATVVFGDGRPLLAHFAAHPVNYEPSELHLRSDWPGAAMRALDAIVLNGALGDVSPNAPGTTADQKVKAIADALSSRAQGGKRVRVSEGSSRLGWAETPIRLGPPRAHREFAKANGVSDELAAILVKKFAPESASVYGLSLGRLAIVGIPGEPTSKLGRRIVEAGKKSGFAAVLVVSHTNGWIGYLLARDDYERGGYEATLAFHGPGAGDATVEAATQCLQDLRGQSRRER